jgi:methyl-accepting chemotaxis protein
VGLAAVVAVLIGVLGLTALSRSAASGDDLYKKNLLAVSEAGEMRVAVGNVEIDSRDALIAPDPAEAQQSLDGLGDYRAAFQTARQAYQATSPSAASQRLLADASTKFDSFMQLAQNKLGPLALANDSAGWYAENNAEADPLVTQVEKDLDQLRQGETAEAKAAAASTDSSYRSDRTTFLAVLALGVLVALGLGLFVAQGIAAATRRVQRLAEALAAGNLTVTSGLRTRDELGRMGSALDTAVQNLRGVMTTVITSADAVAASSEELSASSAQISASAEETSVQSGVVSSAAEEVSRSVQTVAAGAEEMGASIREIASNAAEASEVAQRAVSAAASTTATVAKLG